MKNKNILITALILCIAGSVRAADNVSALKAGEVIARNGTQAGATACIACHGTREEEPKTDSFPRLFNQSRYYIVNQLKDYATGVRANAVMGPIAKALTDEEKENVAAYYSEILFPSPKVKKASAVVLKRGEVLAMTGDAKLEIQGCNNCHGPGGVGLAPAIPALAGQYANYTESQLKAWKNGTRKNSSSQMLEIAKKLSDKDIQALALYFKQVPVRTEKKSVTK